MLNRIKARFFFCCKSHWSCYADTILHGIGLRVKCVCDAHDGHIMGGDLSDSEVDRPEEWERPCGCYFKYQPDGSSILNRCLEHWLD